MYVTIHVFEYYTISAAVLMSGLDNEEQHIFTFDALLTRIYINTLGKHSIALLHQ